MARIHQPGSGTNGPSSGMPIHLLLRSIAQNRPFGAGPLPGMLLADRLHYQWVDREGANMALSKEGLIQELKHEIHSPLAAIRNALYLAAIRTDDPET